MNLRLDQGSDCFNDAQIRQGNTKLPKKKITKYDCTDCGCLILANLKSLSQNKEYGYRIQQTNRGAKVTVLGNAYYEVVADCARLSQARILRL